MPSFEKRPEQAQDISRTVREILDEAAPSPSRQTSLINRRRHFAIGLFFLSLFLVSFAVVLPLGDRWLWGNAGFIYLVVAAWYWDRALPSADSGIPEQHSEGRD